MGNKNIKIMNVSAGSIYDMNNGNRKELHMTDAVLSDSLFTRWLVLQKDFKCKNDATRDIVCVTYNYGSKKYEKELDKLIKEAKKENSIPVEILDAMADRTLSDKDIENCDVEDLQELITDINEIYDKAKKSKTKEEIRIDDYKSNITINWYHKDKKGNKVSDEPITYHFLYRSPAKAKQGSIIYIKNSLWKDAINWLSMGSHDDFIKLGAEADIVSMSAYQTLVTSSLVRDKDDSDSNIVHIPVEKILILKDVDSLCNVPAVSIETKEMMRERPVRNDKGQKVKDENGKVIMEQYKVNGCYVNKDNETMQVKNTLFDGQMLLDDSFFKGKNGCILLRQHFFKACAFRCDIQAYVRDYCETMGYDYDTYTVEDMFGHKMLAKEVVGITTDNAIKWKKFQHIMGEDPYKYWCNIVNDNGSIFGIVKTDHESKWGKYQRGSYQIYGALPLYETYTEQVSRQEAINNITMVSANFANELKKTDNIAFKEYLKDHAQLYNNYGILKDLLDKDERFADTDYFKTEKTTIISDLKRERFMQGKLINRASNLIIVGNAYGMLQYAFIKDKQSYIDNPWDDSFNTVNEGIPCYTTQFEDEALMAGRSPFNSPSNYLYLMNQVSENNLMKKYFGNWSDEIINVQLISTPLQERGNSSDQDSDFFYVTNQPDIVACAKYAYSHYKTIINNIPLVTDIQEEERKNYNIVSYDTTPQSYANMDNNFSATKLGIGLASNIAQLALSYMYNNIANNGDKKERDRLEEIAQIEAILAQVVIDGCKKSYAIDPVEEIIFLQKDKVMQEKGYPKFYADIKKSKITTRKKSVAKKLKKNIKKRINHQLNCPMNDFSNAVDTLIERADYGEQVDIKTYFIDTTSEQRNSSDRKAINNIINRVEEYDHAMNDNSLNDDEIIKAQMYFDRLLESIKRTTIDIIDMSIIIERAFGWAKNKDSNRTNIKNRLLTTCYNKDKDLFLSCFFCDK